MFKLKNAFKWTYWIAFIHSKRGGAVFSLLVLLFYVFSFAAVFAQTTITPLSGTWDIEFNQTGLPVGGGVSKITACLKADSIAAQKEEAFKKAALARQSRTPICSYDYATQTSDSATWQMSCKGGPVTLNGKGFSRWSIDKYSAQETLNGKSPFGGELNIKSTLQAKRVGDC